MNGKDIGQFAVVSLTPDVVIAARVDQLGVDMHMPTGALNASFYYVTHAKLVRDVAQITRRSAFVLHDRSAANDFQIGDFREVVQDFVLHAIGKIGVCLVIAEILKGQNRNALFEY